MARQLNEESRIIRATIAANPEAPTARIVEIINGDGKIKVTAQQVGNQKQALKALAVTAPAGESHQPVLVPDPQDTPAPVTSNGTPKKKGRKPGSKNKAPAVTTTKPPKQPSVVEVVSEVFGLAEKVGGMGQLKKLVEQLTAR